MKYFLPERDKCPDNVNNDLSQVLTDKVMSLVFAWINDLFFMQSDIDLFSSELLIDN